MQYYKNTQGELFVDPILQNHKGLIEITEAEFMLLANPSKSEAELLEEAKQAKREEIEKTFLDSESTPVLYNNVLFAGGESSVDSIDKYVRLMDLAGLTSYNIWDVNGDEHLFNKAEVTQLILAIGMQTAANKFVRKDRLVALAQAQTTFDVKAV